MFSVAGYVELQKAMYDVRQKSLQIHDVVKAFSSSIKPGMLLCL